MLGILLIPAFDVGDFTDPGFSRSGLYVPRFVPRFPVPCFQIAFMNDALFVGVKLELNNINTRTYSGSRTIYNFV